MSKRLLRSFLACIAFIAVLALSALIWLRATAASAETLPELKAGDIVFQTSRSNQSLAIMLASKSPYSHMGIIEILPEGKILVLEAIATVRATPLPEWIERGAGGRLLIKRLDDLTSDQAKAIIAEAHKHFGKPYDLFFHEDRETIYCSELVDYAFRDGIGISFGAYQKASTLDLDNFAARKVIERRWRKHPYCADGKAASFEECYAKISEQQLITPHSIATDPKLATVFSNYGALGE